MQRDIAQGTEQHAQGTVPEAWLASPPTGKEPRDPPVDKVHNPQKRLAPGNKPGASGFPGKRRRRVTTTTTGITEEKRFPAAAGGDAGRQLRRLRAHRAFQRQDKHGKVRIDWATTISREESRRHITRHLQAKINLKDPRQGSRGGMDTPEGQDSMKRLARMIQGRHRLSPGDGHTLSWNLRHRMVQSGRSHLSDESTPTREQCFPPKIRAVLDELQELRELLSRQGASTKRHRHPDLRLRPVPQPLPPGLR